MMDIAQAAGVDALGLTKMIVTAARNATTHRKNCERIATHVKIIGNLLENLKSTDVMSFPVTGEPLDQLEQSLRKALELVESCRDKSYLYMLALGWTVVYQFRQVQAEIDRYLQLVPLISLVHKSRNQAIEEDEYSLDEEDRKTQNIILKRDRTKKDAKVLERSLSRQYPDLGFKEALQEEKEKLQIELQRSQVNNDPKQCRVIEHLIEVTEHVVNVPGNKLIIDAQAHTGGYPVTGYRVSEKSSFEDIVQSEWQADLFGCCKEPCLCLMTCLYPCRTFSWIANMVTNGEMSRELAVHDMMAYTLFCGCCCYTCCMRQKLRKLFNIEGGACDDFLTHLICCCCAMVQEWRELELRGYKGCEVRKMIPPPFQYMKP